MIGIFLPRECVLCGRRNGAAWFCSDCRSELPWIAAACERCGEPLASVLSAGSTCAGCQLRPPPFRKAYAPLVYTFPVDSALKALKFRRQLYLAPAFGDLLPAFHAAFFAEADALLPVPLHRSRHFFRGFNQASELSRPLQRTTGLPLVTNIRRVRSTRPQTGLDAAERRQNMKAAFEVCGTLCCRYPLVVDDVITTGETCRQLAETLLCAGAEKVDVLAVARAASA